MRKEFGNYGYLSYLLTAAVSAGESIGLLWEIWVLFLHVPIIQGSILGWRHNDMWRIHYKINREAKIAFIFLF